MYSTILYGVLYVCTTPSPPVLSHPNSYGCKDLLFYRHFQFVIHDCIISPPHFQSLYLYNDPTPTPYPAKYTYITPPPPPLITCLSRYELHLHFLPGICVLCAIDKKICMNVYIKYTCKT